MIRVGFSFSKPPWSVLSWVIAKAIGRPYSHVFLILTESDGFRGRDVVLEAGSNGVHVVPLDGFTTKHTIVKVIDPPQPLGTGVDATVDLLGLHYDTRGLFGMAWVVTMGRWLGRKVRNPLNDPKSLWCSELVALVIQASGYQNAARIDPSRMGPEDIDDLLAGKYVD